MFSSVPTARPRIAGLHAALAKMPLKRLVRPRQENAAGAPKKGVAEPGEEAAARQAVRDLDALPQFFESVAFLRSEEHTSELQSLMRISYAVYSLKKKKTKDSTK